jgi:hypothetical protein
MQLNPVRCIAIAITTAASLWAQAPAKPKVTHVLATLTVKEGVSRDQITQVLDTEVRETVKLYLDGKIGQWYARGDGKGVVFLMDCATVDEAKAILDTLPLIKGNLASFEYMPVGPLTPLRLLVAPPAR